VLCHISDGGSILCCVIHLILVTYHHEISLILVIHRRAISLILVIYHCAVSLILVISHCAVSLILVIDESPHRDETLCLCGVVVSEQGNPGRLLGSAGVESKAGCILEIFM